MHKAFLMEILILLLMHILIGLIQVKKQIKNIMHIQKHDKEVFYVRLH